MKKSERFILRNSGERRKYFLTVLRQKPRTVVKVKKNFVVADKERQMQWSINQFSGPAYPWEVAGAAVRVGASTHLDPLQQRIDALLGCQGETN